MYPEANAATITSASGSGRTSAISGSASPNAPNVAVRRMRRGFQRSRTIPLAITPASIATRTAAQAAGPPRWRFATAGPEHEQRPGVQRVDDPELDHDRPQPPPAPEVAPAHAQVVEHRCRLGALGRPDAHRRERRCGEPIGDCVGRDRPAGARRRDDDPAERCAPVLVAVSPSRNMAFACWSRGAGTVCGMTP